MLERQRRPSPDVLTSKAPLTVGAADPAVRDREAMGWVQSNYSTGFGSTWGVFRAPVAGRYRLTFSGYTVWVGPGGTRTPTLSFIGKTPPGGDPRQTAVLPPEWYRPNFREISPGRRYEPIAIYAKGGTNRRIGEFDLTPEAAAHPIGEVWLAANDVIAPDATRFFRSRPTGIPDGYTNPLAQRDGMPAVAFQWMDVEGPIYDEPAGRGYRLLFGDLPVRKAEPGDPGVLVDTVADRPLAAEDRRFGRAGGGFGRVPPTVPAAVEVVSQNPAADADRLLRSFLAQAYRQPVAEADVQLFLGLIHRQLDAGLGFAGAMPAGYTAVLSSPKFITLEETPGRLDDWALATRLSLFLWNSIPDPALRALADRGELHRRPSCGPRPSGCSTTRRRPASSRPSSTTGSTFGGSTRRRPPRPSTATTTLTTPSRSRRWPRRGSSSPTSWRTTGPARNVVDSDYTFLNERLARHYGIPG